MAGTLPLILSQEPVSRGLLAKMKESRPNIAVVYSDAFGQISYFGGRPLKWSEQVSSRYRVRYEVDLSDHRRTARLDSSPLPSRGDAYFFHSMVDVGFRVTDPAAVVKRNVTDGLAVVYNYLIDTFRPITRNYEIGEAAAAEAAINRYFQQPVPLPEGITIYHCRARLLPDEAAKDHLRAIEEAKRSLTVGKEEHEVAVATARHTQELAEIEQTGRLDAERRELGALREPVNLEGLIRTHLSKHPDDTAHAMHLLLGYEQAKLERRGADDQRWLDLVRYMIDNDIIQAVDVEMLRKQTLNKVQQIAIPAPDGPGADDGWDKPLPMLSLTAEPSSQAATPGRAQQAEAASVVPVYLIIDESVTEDAYYQALDDGLQELPTGLAEQPGVLAAVRLAILGYARDVLAHMPVNAVTTDTMIPRLAPRPGANLGALFAYLRSCLPSDMERLKSRHPTVVRPTAYLLCATEPDTEPEWQACLQNILDRTAFRYGPNIVACGVGAMPPQLLETIGGQPGCHAFYAEPGTSLQDATRNYVSFVQREIAAQVRAQLSGRTDVSFMPPDQFHPVRGLS
jgi:uncharacterized protein YegL